MTANQQVSSVQQRKRESPSALSRWFQHRMNARMITKIKRNKPNAGTFMGMDVLLLHTVRRRSGEPQETPVAWFADGGDARLIVGSGGGNQDPDWYLNLMAHPEQARIEWPGQAPVPVTPQVLAGAMREQAWSRIATAAPRIAKYQAKSDRQYPVVRLTPR